MRDDQTSFVPARIESMSDGLAICWVEVAGAELPTEFPSKPLEGRGLISGSRFMVRLNGDDSFDPGDIRDAPPIELSPEEKAESQRLYAGLLERIASGNPWGLNPKEDQ